MIKKFLYSIIVLLLIAFPILIYGATQSAAVLSPGCSQSDLKKMAGDALLHISKKQNWGNDAQGFIIKLDNKKMDMGTLTKKMMEKKCHEQKTKAVKQTVENPATTTHKAKPKPKTEWWNAPPKPQPKPETDWWNAPPKPQPKPEKH